MSTQSKVLEVIPENAGIEKVEIKCPDCGEFQVVFGGWPSGYLLPHVCRNCKAKLVLQINRQEKLI